MIAAAPVPADVVTTPGQLGGVPVIRIDIPGTTTDGVIVYFHGGFFAIGSAAASVGLAVGLARQARMPVVTVDYRLAPEHPCPAAPDDAMTAYRACSTPARTSPASRSPANPPAPTWPR
jgi:acetyl esterase/lipase